MKWYTKEMEVGKLQKLLDKNAISIEAISDYFKDLFFFFLHED